MLLYLVYYGMHFPSHPSTIKENVMKSWRGLVLRFCNQTLPKADWTHKAHLVVALWFLLECNDTEFALSQLKAAITRFNRAMGKLNVIPHETITVFWVMQVRAFVESNTSRDFDVLAEALLDGTALTDKDYIYRFYSREVLSTPRARDTYVVP